MYPDLAERHGALLHQNFLGALDAARQEGAPLSDLMQADGLHPTARGVERIVADIGPRVEALIDRIRGGDPS
jgi:acyl-CoA thioesterase-1